MKETYKNYPIELNQWGEYCVIKQHDTGMIAWNAGFPDLETAKKMVDWLVNHPDVSQKQIETQAGFFKPWKLR